MDFFCHPLFLYLRRPLVDFAFLWERRYPLQGYNVPLGTPLSPSGIQRSFGNAVIPFRDTTFLLERRTIHFRDTTLRGYSGTFRTLNGERLPFSHLKVSNGR